MARELESDVIIVGGGVGGCAAALGAASRGRRVIMTEETDWIGGQLTAQGVPPDEHRWIESHGCTRQYRRYRDGVREYYRRHYPLSPEAAQRKDLNPGNGSVSRICHEPRVGLAVLEAMLAPYQSAGRVTVLLEHRAVQAETQGDHVVSVTVEDLRDGEHTVLHGRYFVDATELGDLLPLSRTEHVTGAEAQADTEEPHAAAEAQPDNMQAFTCCFAMDYVPGEDHTIEKPREYAFWRDYVPALTPPWTGRLLAWETTHPVSLKPRTMYFDPLKESPEHSGMWRYRRIAHRANFLPDTYPGDICLVNWPQNDYWLGNLYGGSGEEAGKHLARAKQLSLSLLYWLQTEAPREDGKTGWPGLRLRPDVMGTKDGLAKYPYIRESRRIRAEFTVLEQHVGKEARMALTGAVPDAVRAAVFADTAGIGYYRLDLHPSSGGVNYIDIDSLRYQIPLGALIPVRVNNLLPACKNLGVTHITNGCYRLHPTEWNIGEAAGALAAFCLERDAIPRAVRNTRQLLEEFQQDLVRHGVELAWPEA